VSAGGRPSKLTAELVSKAKQEAAHGLPLALIADRLGIGRRTAQTWIRDAENKGEDSLEYQFRRAIFIADAEECKNLVTCLRDAALPPKPAKGEEKKSPNLWAATWLLTHHPRLRDHFSDAAAERRTERKTIATVVDAIAAAGLTPEDESRVLLQINARGLVTPEGELGDEVGQS
jgi:transposase